MVDPLYTRDALDIATEAYWAQASLPEQLTRVEPWTEDDTFTIPDLTDDEWSAFTQALKA